MDLPPPEPHAGAAAPADPPRRPHEHAALHPGVEGAAPPRRPLTGRNYVWLAGAAIVLAAMLTWLGPVLMPFLVGVVFAYLGAPLMKFAERRRVPRGLAATGVVVLFALAVVALFVVLLPLVESEFSLAARRVPDLAAKAAARLSAWLKETFDITLALDPPAFKAFLAEHADDAQDLSRKLLPAVKAGGLLVMSILVNLALIPVVMFYLLRDGKMIALRVNDLLPRHWEGKVRIILKQIDAVLAEFVRGQLMVMTVLAIYYAVGLSLAGLDRAVAIGILTGLLVFIPYVGFGLGLVLGVLAAILQWSGWGAFLGVLSVYGIGQLLENYILVPWLVGDRIGLHPLAVIFSLLAFGHLFGFSGVLLALPVSAALLVGLRHLRAAYLESPVYRGTR